MGIKRAALVAALCVAALLVEDALAPLAEAQTATPEIVLAQAEGEQRGGVFRFLTRPFRRRQPEPQVAPQPQQEQARPRRQREASRPRRERQPQAEPEAPRVAAVEKAEDAQRVLVVGDFWAGALAKGLIEAYAENPNVLIVDASNGSSGLVRDDHYNWPEEAPGIIEEQKPIVTIVLVGGNDRQSISGAGDPGSETWRAAYGTRVGALTDAIKEAGQPLLWVGLPPADSDPMSRDYSAFNGIVREQLEGRGMRFIDIWDGFADAEGRFVAVGPDVSGQEVELRSGEFGLSFTRAGQRKLAFFVEQDLNSILGGVIPVVAATDGGATEAEPGEPVPQIGPMVTIDSLTLGDALSGAAPTGESGAAATAVLERLSGDRSAPEGRADNFVWPAGATP